MNIFEKTFYMPANKNALLRYKTIDNCLRKTSRRWTLDDLVEACSDALYEYTGRDVNLSIRTIQLDIQKMRSSELGYNAPIIVKDRKYYCYEDPDFSITNTPLTDDDLVLLKDAIQVLKQLSGFSSLSGVEDIVGRLEDHVNSFRQDRKPVIYFEGNNRLRGLQFITPLYEAIVSRIPVNITYQSFKASEPQTYTFSPYILKEYRNRWFIFGKGHKDEYIVNLALDRIKEVVQSPEEKFIDTPDFDPEYYFKDMIGVTKNPDAMDRVSKIQFIANAQIAPYIETKPIHESQMIIEKKEDGSVIFQLKCCENYELERALIEFGEGVKVLSPEALVKKIQARLKQAAEQYEK